MNMTANRRISNIEPQNNEGMFRFAQALFKQKSDYKKEINLN